MACFRMLRRMSFRLPRPQAPPCHRHQAAQQHSAAHSLCLCALCPETKSDCEREGIRSCRSSPISNTMTNGDRHELRHLLQRTSYDPLTRTRLMTQTLTHTLTLSRTQRHKDTETDTDTRHRHLLQRHPAAQHMHTHTPLKLHMHRQSSAQGTGSAAAHTRGIPDAPLTCAPGLMMPTAGERQVDRRTREERRGEERRGEKRSRHKQGRTRRRGALRPGLARASKCFQAARACPRRWRDLAPRAAHTRRQPPPQSRQHRVQRALRPRSLSVPIPGRLEPRHGTARPVRAEPRTKEPRTRACPCPAWHLAALGQSCPLRLRRHSLAVKSVEQTSSTLLTRHQLAS